ncbi:MAG: HD-GYP domain-containing protein [bacterium]
MKSLASQRFAGERATLRSLALRIADAGGVLVPTDASAPLPEAARTDGMLAAMLTSPYGRRVVAQAARQCVSASGVEASAVEHFGVAIVQLPLPRSHVAGSYVAATIAEDALGSNDFMKLANYAQLDAWAARDTLRGEGLWRASALARFARTVVALARAEGDRLAGLESGEQLSTAWEELHLLHSLAEAMGHGIAPAEFARRTLSEARRTLGCLWTAIRIEGTAAAIIGLKPGEILVDGEDCGLAETVLRESRSVTAAAIVDPQLVVAPLGQDGARFGAFAAGGLVDADGRENESGMSSVERTLVGTAAGNLSVFIDNARLARDRDRLFIGALSALVATIDAKDPYTRGHSQRVALLSEQIAMAAGLPEKEVTDISIAGLVHDVGKIAVPESVLRKKERLTDEEFALIKQHPERGFHILRDIPDSTTILEGVLHHHERYEGGGYPHGLAGAEIPVAARIIAIADTFDAMSSTRTYRRAIGRSNVLAEMEALSGHQFDPVFLKAFLRIDLARYDELVEHDMRNAPLGGDVSSLDILDADSMRNESANPSLDGLLRRDVRRAA